MRKVIIKQWIPIKYESAENGLLKQVPGTSCMSKDFLQEGKFHQWGTEIEEDNNGFVSRSIAIVELPDGTIESVLPNHVKFLD